MNPVPHLSSLSQGFLTISIVRVVRSWVTVSG